MGIGACSCAFCPGEALPQGRGKRKGFAAAVLRRSYRYFNRSAVDCVPRRRTLFLLNCRRSVAVLLYPHAAHTVYYSGAAAVAATAWYL